MDKLSVGPLDVYDDRLDDKLFLKEFFKMFFQPGDNLFVSFRREENLTDDLELLRLRKTVPNEFRKKGDYSLLRKYDEERFDGVAWIPYEIGTSAFLLNVWKYFYAFTVLKPADSVTWEDYCKYVKEEGLEDVDGKKMLNRRFADFILIKGLGGDYVNVTYTNSFRLPNIELIT